VDLLYFATRRLRFIQTLYESAVGPFRETKRQIAAGEPPYVDTRNPEDYDGEPAFLSEWEDADDAAMVVGHWCLCMVQATLQAYLRDCIGPLGSLWWNSSELRRRIGRKQGNWFQRYRMLFLEDLGVDWQHGPVPLVDLEQLNLTRDDLIHNIDMMSFNVKRVENHAEQFPIGLFTDDLWQGLGIERVRVDEDRLVLAIHLVTKFCGWLEGIRCGYPQYINKSISAEAQP